MTTTAQLSDWLATDMTLTPIELRITRVLARDFGEWLATADMVRQVYGDRPDTLLLDYDRRAFRTHMWRLRHKLEAHSPWRIENRYRHGVYRLVEA